jgi:hypothetical protein
MVDKTWIGGTASWSGASFWSPSGVPTAADNVIFSANGPYTVTLPTTANCNSLTVTGSNVTFTGTSGTLNVNGDFTINSTTAWSATSATIAFAGNSTVQNITTSGVTLTSNISITGSVPLRLMGPLTMASSKTFTHTISTINLNGYPLTCGLFSTSNSNVRNIDFTGGGSITLTGTSGTIFTCSTATNFTYTGTSAIYVNGSGTTSTIIGPNTTTENEDYTLNFYITFSTTTLQVSQSFKNLIFSNSSITISGATRKIYGDLTFPASSSISGTTNFSSTSATTRVINFNGNLVSGTVAFNGVGGSWQLSSAHIGGVSSGFSITHTNGTIDLNNRTLITGSYTTNGGVKNITFNGGTLRCTDATTTAFNNLFPTGFSTTAGSGTGRILMDNSPQTFVGGSQVYNCNLALGYGSLTVTGSNTFKDIVRSGSGVRTILFADNITTTVETFSLSGSSGNLVTIGGSPGSTNNFLQKTASGDTTCDYLSISRSSFFNVPPATGTRYAGANSVNGGNNAGWTFTAPPVTANTGAFFSVF